MRFFPSTLSITLLALNAQSSLGLPLADDSALKPTSIDCGTTSDDLSPPIYAGIPNVSPPDYTDLRKAAQRLSKKGGTCSTPAGGGNCVRVACDNTTGFWMCNADGRDGPYDIACTDVAAFVYRGEDDGVPTNDLWMTCRNAGLYAINSVSGKAFDRTGNWFVWSGYANCNHSPSNPPDAE